MKDEMVSGLEWPESVGRVFVFPNEAGVTVLAGFGEDALFMGTDENTFLTVKGKGSVTAIFGDGYNVAKGGAGEDVFIGGDGANTFYGGRGNDFLMGGNGPDNLFGGAGFDTITFGEWDSVSGGLDSDIFTFMPNGVDEEWFDDEAAPETIPEERGTEWVWFRDFAPEDGDVLNLVEAGISADNLELRIEEGVDYRSVELVYHGPKHDVLFGNIGAQIEFVGGIQAAIDAGTLWVADPFSIG